jgi:hypothetical protein
MSTFTERLAFQSHLDTAASKRKNAAMFLRMGDRWSHRHYMHQALHYLKLARQWRRK